jgi:hypothetical protein
MKQHARANLRLIIVCVGLTLLLSPVLLTLLAGAAQGARAQAASTAEARTAAPQASEIVNSAPAEITQTPAVTSTPTVATIAEAVDDLIVVNSVDEALPGTAFSASIVLLTNQPDEREVVITTQADPGLVVDSLSGADCHNAAASATCTLLITDERPGHITVQLHVAADAAAGYLQLRAEAADAAGGGDRASAAVRVVDNPAQSGATQVTAAQPTVGSDEPLLGTAVVVTPLVTPIGATSVPADPPAATPASEGSSDTAASTLSPTPMPGTVPDSCEENDTLLQPCALPSEAQTTELNFVDDGIDVFSFLLKANRSYTIRASSTTGVDPVVTVYLAGATDAPVAQNDDAQPGTTDALVVITTDADGWYIVKVENKAPGAMRARTYALSARSAARGDTATPVADGATSQPVSQLQRRGDAFENNWSLETAGYLGWAVPYDLSLVCPQEGACRDGDHDFFRVQVKRDVPFIAATYDLGPGTDTTIALYKPTPGFTDPSTGLSGWQLVQYNDDVARGYTLRSEVQLLPDWDGDALIIVAASDRQDAPTMPVAVGPAGRYRLIAGSALMPAILEVLEAQQDGPSLTPAEITPTAPFTPAAAPAVPVAPIAAPATATPPPQAQAAPTVSGETPDDDEELIREECLTGAAQTVIDDAVFYAAAMPQGENRRLITYPKGTTVELIGACYGGWVKVRPMGAVTPGYMWAPDLILVEEAGVPATSSTAGPVAGGAPVAPVPSGTPQPSAAGSTLPVVAVEPEPVAPETPQQRVQVSVIVQITTADERGRPGMRVQLTNALGDVLGEAITAPNGLVTVTGETAPGTALRMVIPALGVDMPVQNGQQVAVAVPA